MSPAEEPYGAGVGETLVPPRERQVRMRQCREGSPQSSSSCLGAIPVAWAGKTGPARSRMVEAVPSKFCHP